MGTFLLMGHAVAILRPLRDGIRADGDRCAGFLYERDGEPGPQARWRRRWI